MPFSDEEKKNLLCELRQKAATAASYSVGNQIWDIAFKVILLVVSLWIIVCGAAATATKDQAISTGWSVASTILGGASTAIAAFAFSQFNFEQRQRIYRKKADSLVVLCDRLRFLNPDKEEFLRELALVDALNDYSPLSASVDAKGVTIATGTSQSAAAKSAGSVAGGPLKPAQKPESPKTSATSAQSKPGQGR